MKEKRSAGAVTVAVRGALMFALVPLGEPLFKATFTASRELADDVVRNASEDDPIEIWELRRIDPATPSD